MSSRATSFYYSFLALPAGKRNAIVAVWDFCRAVDDAVDEPGDRDPVSALEQWRTEVAHLYQGREPATPQGMRLAPFIARFALPRSAFEDLIDGVAMDLQRNRYDTFDELRQTVCASRLRWLDLLEIFGYRERRHAISGSISASRCN